MKEYTKEYLDKVCERIKSMGFRVFVKKDSTYGYFSDGKSVGYFQLEWGGSAGISISTVNAKGSGCSGYRVYDGEEDTFTVNQLTRDLLRKAFVTYPEWVKGYDLKRVVKYNDLDDFLKNYWKPESLKEL